MLRDEQIQIRRKRAQEERLEVQKLGRNRVFSDYLVSNPDTGGRYRVAFRGFDVGDNSCECPDFKANTLGTCKHIERVRAMHEGSLPPSILRKKAVITQPEVYVHYGEQMRIGLHLPQRTSDQLRALAEDFFDINGLWTGQDYEALLQRLDEVPEQVNVFSDALELIQRELEREEMAELEVRWLQAIEREELPSALFDLLKVPLYPYQLRGAVFAACRGRCILGDDMGLGKTVQTLAAAEVLARVRGIQRVLVISPASVKYQWEAEARKFTRREVQVIDGGSQRRRSLYQKPTFYRLVSYEAVVKDHDLLNAWKPDLIVLDEAQRIKNWESKTSRAVKKLRSRYALVLTGTPLENNLEELYSIVQFVDARRLGPAFQFLHDHRVLGPDGELLGYRDLGRIREKLAPIFLRRTRGEVLSQLPARTDTTLWLEMSPAQRALHDEHQAALARLLQKQPLGEDGRTRVLACLSNMRLACASPALLDPAAPSASPKLDELDELLRSLLPPGGSNKAVVFTQWEKMALLAEEVARRHFPGCALLTGSVPGPRRRELLERFRDDQECRVFVSTDAGCSGLNLQSADTVINLESPWSPAVLEQRVARVHRMGQHNPVQVFHLVMRGSVEERVLEVLRRKRALFDELFAGEADEISFTAAGQQAFLDALREAFAPTAPAPPPAVEPEADPPAPVVAPAGVQEAGIAFILALTAALEDGSLRLPEALRERGAAALEGLVAALRAASGPPHREGEAPAEPIDA
jgi:SNF2 family DNA or RNA helicase